MPACCCSTHSWRDWRVAAPAGGHTVTSHLQPWQGVDTGSIAAKVLLAWSISASQSSAHRITQASPSCCSVLPPVADATAYLHAETSPWPTKGGTACTEVASQPAASRLLGSGAAKTSIPESPVQLRDAGSTGSRKHNATGSTELPHKQQQQQQQEMTPVAFWNADLATPDAAPEGQLIRAYYGRDELPTPLYPATSPSQVPPGTTPLPFSGSFSFRGPKAALSSCVATPDSIPGSMPLRDSTAQQQQQPSPSSAAAQTPWGDRSPLWEKAHQSLHEGQPPLSCPSRLANCSSGELLRLPSLQKCGSFSGSLASGGSLLAPYSPAASGSNVGEEDMLSWRHGQSHFDGEPQLPSVCARVCIAHSHTTRHKHTLRISASRYCTTGR